MLAINVACVGTLLPVTSTPIVTAQVVDTAPTTDSTNFDGIQINGKPAFIIQTRAALSLLKQKDLAAFKKIKTYIGIIEQGQHSGMWAWEEPPRYEVGDQTAFYSVTWYASTIAHDATHSELYAQYHAANPGLPVPEDAYGGVEIERLCNSYQLEVLKRINAPQIEIDYMSTLDGTHCDIDHDGDCDWQDYQHRSW
jgi:hypothetical protein